MNADVRNTSEPERRKKRPQFSLWSLLVWMTAAALIAPHLDEIGSFIYTAPLVFLALVLLGIAVEALIELALSSFDNLLWRVFGDKPRQKKNGEGDC